MAPYSDICSFVRLYKGSDSAVYTSVYKEKCLNWSHGRRETLLMTNRQLMLIVSLCDFFYTTCSFYWLCLRSPFEITEL